MFPRLFSIGGFTLHTYGVLIAIAFLVGLWVLGHQAARAGVDRNRAIDLGVYALIAGLVGSKMLLVVVDWRAHLPTVHAIFWVLLGMIATAPLAYRYAPRFGKRVWLAWAVLAAAAFGFVAWRFDFDRAVWSQLKSLGTSAGVFYGGFLLAAVVALLYMRRQKLPVWPMLDAMAPAVAIGQAIGRLGCLSAGCCYGRECSLPWAITFRDAWATRHLGTPPDVPLHPTQLYSSLAALVIFLILIWMAPRKRFYGQVAVVYAATYAVGRFVIEFFRDDPRGFPFGGWMSTSQVIAIVVFVLAIVIAPYLWKRQRITAAAAQ